MVVDEGLIQCIRYRACPKTKINIPDTAICALIWPLAMRIPEKAIPQHIIRTIQETNEKEVLNNSFIKQFIDAFTNPFEVRPAASINAIKGGKEFNICKMIEDPVDSTMGFWRQVALYQFMK